MKQKRKLGRKLLSFLLTLAMVVGLFPGMSLTAYAADTTITWDSSVVNSITLDEVNESYNNSGITVQMTAKGSVGVFSNNEMSGSATFVFSSTVGNIKGITINAGNTGYFPYDGWTKGSTTVTWSGTPASSVTLIGNPISIKNISSIVFTIEGANVDVAGVTLSPDAAQTIEVGGSIAFKATVAPDGATDKTVKWSVGGTNANAVKLYSDSNCTQAVGTAATSTLTVYAKGTAAGSATVTATSNADSAKSASCNVTVNKADPTAPTGLTATYGQKLSDVVLPTGWTWADSTQSVGNVVSPAATFKANFAGDDNYNAASNVDVTVTVSKADATTAMQAASVSIASTSGKTATVSYTLPDDASYGAVTNSNTEFFTVDTTSGIVLTAAKNWTASDWATDASKTFTVAISGATNYNDYTLTVTVTPTYKATQTITAADVTATYGDTGKKIEASTTSGGGTLSYAVKSGDAVTVNETTGALTIVKAGGAVITVTAAETDTYAKATKDVNVTVNTKAMTVSAEDVNVTVDGQPHGITVNVTDPATGYTVKYGTEAGSYTLDASPTQTEVGEKTVYYQVTADNYTTYTGSAKVTVSAKQTQTITAADVTANYGDTDKKVSATTNGNGAISYAVKDGSGEYIEVNSSTGALTIKKVGTATVIVTAAETSTYAQATKEVTVTINKGEGGGTPSANTLVYNGSAQALVTAGKAEGGTMQYALGENADTAPEASAFTASIPTGVDAKTYYVWYMVKGDANHNDTKPACVEATITKKGLTVTADAKSKTQGEADPALTYTAEGLVGSDTLTGALSREAGEDPGTYAITQGTLTAGDNYEIAFTSAVLTINKKEAPAPSGGGGSSGGGYYGGGTVQNQRRDAYSDVIGAAATNFRDSSPERIHNIELACEKLDGTVLQPGEVFSFNEAVGGLTAEAGFAVAPVNPDDEATAEMGGGVSQVASTLYTGSLFALLETVERTNHPYAVPFIQPGTDAYVTDPGNADALDLKFRNTRTEPIRISAKTRVDEARQVREIVIELRSALGSSDYMPIRFDNTWGGDQNAFLTETPYDLTRPGYRILLTHEEQQFTDASGAGIRTLTHRKILDAAGMLVRDEILNSKLPDGSCAMDTYYQG